MDIEMINPWTQVKSYDGHFERSQTLVPCEIENGTGNIIYSVLLIYLFLFLALWLIVIK